MKQEKNTAIVLAAGQGKRMNSRIQKQFLDCLLYTSTCAVWSGFDNNEKLPEDARNFHKNLWKKVIDVYKRQILSRPRRLRVR